MTKTMKWAYPVVVVTARGKRVEPGTPVSLPEDEAIRLRSAFGTIEPTAPVRRARNSSETEQAKLEDEVNKRAAAVDEAADLVEKDPSEANRAALEKAQRDLVAAQDALKAAQD